mmetsp:Transcript_25587/g.59029  ORF Transcript_25587/g.59029 Transcript_25587/m.59029 type:complete len:554 (-) Transcript_25587:524-2185(-)
MARIILALFLGVEYISRQTAAFVPKHGGKVQSLSDFHLKKGIYKSNANASVNNRARTLSLASSSLNASITDEVLEAVDPILQGQPDLCDDPLRERKRKTRFLSALPKLGRTDELDRTILATAIPSMISLAVVPVVNAVDTYWVGRLGNALALAGQSAANQACWSVFFLVAFLPNITAPLVASAVASGNMDDARERVSETIFLCAVLGAVGTAVLALVPRQTLSAMVLSADAPAMDFASPYLRWRALGMVPALISATGFAAYRGLLNTVTPLKVSLLTSGANLVLDPLFIFYGRFGFIGAAMATGVSELLGGLTYLKLLFRRKLANWSMITKPPSTKALAPLIKGGAAMLIRQMAINVGLIAATRRAQVLDPSGVTGAAYGICMQIYNIGIVIIIAMQGSAAALVPANLAQCGEEKARECADRLLGWSALIGTAVGAMQFFLLPFVVPMFSTLPEVREAVRVPAIISALMQVVNGPVFGGEGIMLGLGSYRDLALITWGGIVAMILTLASPIGKGLDGIMWSLLSWSVFQSVGTVLHYLKISPLAVKRKYLTSK